MSATPAPDAKTEPALGAAWALLLHAARDTRPQAAPLAAPARPSSDGVGALGQAGEPLPAADPRAWLVGDRAGGWSAGPAAPPAARAMLDLYGPLCVQGPLTVGHLGQSLDGYIATGSGDSYYVTGPANVRHLHRLRALCDAVIVGAGTVARDDPRLTVRHVEGPSPVRVVLDPRRRLPLDRRVFTADGPPTLLVCGDERSAPARHGAAEVVALPLADDRLRLADLVRALRARGLAKLFVEGGGVTVSSFIAAGLLDRLHLAIAPLVTGRGTPGLGLPARDKIADCLRPQHRVFTMGGDVLYDCDLRALQAGAAAGDGLARVL